MADSINNKAKEYYDNDNTGGSLNNNLKDFLKQQGAEGNSLNTLWRNYAYGEGGNSLNTRLGKLWGTSGSLIKRWKDVLGLTWDDLKLFFNARRNDPELLLSGATSFNGTDDYISFPFQESGNYTISAWFKLDVAQTSIVVNWGDQATGERRSLLIWNGGAGGYHVYSSTYGSNIAGSTVLSTGVWYHASVTVDVSDGSAKVYLNGSLDGSGTHTINSFTGTTGEIGRQPNGEYFEGSIANVGIWNRALSASEIESIYWKGQYADLKGTELTNLVSWYNLKDTSLGSEKSPNVTFDSNITGWSGTNWAWESDGEGGGRARHTAGSTAHLQSGNILTVGLQYEVSFTVGGRTAGSVFTRAGASGSGTSRTANGDYTETLTCLTNGIMYVSVSSDFDGYVDNVSFKPIEAPDSTTTNNGSIYGATFLTDAYSASSPFLPRIQDKATPKGAVALASGSTSFDGSDDYIDIGDQQILTTAGTLSCWVKLDSNDSRNIINKFDSGAGKREYMLYTNASGHISFTVQDSAGSYDSNTDALSSTTLNTGIWYFISATFSTSEVAKLYVDGSLVASASASISDAIDNTNEPIYLGQGVNSGTPRNFFNGSIANVAIYSDAKTQSQIQDIMFSSYSTLTSELKTNLVSWYDLGSTPSELGSETLLRITFDSGTAGWSAQGNNTLSNVDGEVKITYVDNIFGATYFVNSSGGNASSDLTVGGKYKLQFDARVEGGNSLATVRIHTVAEGLVDVAINSTMTTYTAEFTASSATGSNIRFVMASGESIFIDNLSLKPLETKDSQGSNNGFVVGATTNTGYTNSPSGVADPLNYGEVYGGNAVSFDGTNDYIDLDGFKFSGNQASFSFWVKFDSLSGNHPKQLIDLDTNRTIVYYVVNTGLSIYSNNATVTFGTLDINTWYHIVGIFDGTTARMYVDGSQLGTDQTIVALDISSATQCKIGANFVPSGSYFDGMMSGVKVFNTALTQDQVRELYTKPELTLPTGISSSALKLDMPMQEGSGTAILDGSGNQNHGTGNGITWATGQEYGFQHPLVRSNNPMVFDGADDKVAVGTPSALNNIFTGGGTLSAWINPKSDGQNNAGQAFDKSKYAFQVIGESSGSVKVQFAVTLSGGAARWETPRSVSLNTWTHILVTYDSDNPTTDPIIYLNGSAVSLTETISPSGTYVSDATSNLVIGNRNDGVTTFDGLLNDLAIWSSALTANEVTALYNSGLPLLPTANSGNYASADDLVGYWRNDGVTTWTDRSTNSNNGTVAGDPASIIVPEGLNEGRDSQGYYLTDTDSISSGIRFKGAEYISVQDSETLSFGNGTSDSPFSLEAWVKMDDATSFPIVMKGVYNSNAEWHLSTQSGNELFFILYDESVSNTYEGAKTSAITSYEGQWIHITGTYDGRGGTSANNGLKIYINGSSQSLTLIGSGTYVAMENLGANVEVGKTGSSTFAKGSIDEVKVYAKELSATEVLKNYNNGKSAHSN